MAWSCALPPLLPHRLVIEHMMSLSRPLPPRRPPPPPVGSSRSELPLHLLQRQATLGSARSAPPAMAPERAPSGVRLRPRAAGQIPPIPTAASAHGLGERRRPPPARGHSTHRAAELRPVPPRQLPGQAATPGSNLIGRRAAARAGLTASPLHGAAPTGAARPGGDTGLAPRAGAHAQPLSSRHSSRVLSQASTQPE